MSELIQWPRAMYWDKAWNPIVGCRKCSPACENCWAEAMMERFKQDFKPHEVGNRKIHRGREYLVTKPCPKKGVVFAGNMTDLFGEWVEYPEHYVTRGIDAGGTADAVLWLTKRTARLEQFFREFGPLRDFKENGWLENQFFGFTAESQGWFDWRMTDIFATWPEWANLWVSFEPLLGPVELSGLFLLPVRWVVVGCESGPRRRPCKVEWVESIVHQCICAGVPVFVKQLDLGGRCVTDITRFPEHLRIRQVPWAKRGGNP